MDKPTKKIKIKTYYFPHPKSIIFVVGLPIFVRSFRSVSFRFVVLVWFWFGLCWCEWAAMAASAEEVRRLFRALLREAHRFAHYNVREYVKRRTIDGFREYKDQKDPVVVEAAYKRGLQQLEVARRQAVVYSLYAPRVKSIMEIQSSK
jgi:hypothetical protein